MRVFFALLTLIASSGALAQSAGVYGQTGVKRVTSAEIGPGLLHLGGAGRGFYAGDFIAPGAVDEDTYLGSTVWVGARLLSLLELSLAAQVGVNANSVDDPRTRFSAGDLYPSLKVGYGVGSMAFGLDVRGLLPTAQDAAGVDFGNAGVAGTGLFTLDLSESAFVRLHVNGGYVFQAGKGDQNNLLQGLPGHLLALAAQQWFYDQALYGVAVEAPLPYVTPYLEIFGQTALGAPGGYTPFLDGHLSVSPGARIQPTPALAIDVGADIGVLGTANDLGALTDGQPINPTWAVHLGLSYAFDPFAAPGAAPARRAKKTPEGVVLGCVTDAATGAPVAGAFVDLGDAGASRLAAGEDGCFRSYALDVGERTLQVSHPDYKGKSAAVTVEDGGEAKADVALVPLVRVGKLAGTVKTLKGSDAEVELVINRGDAEIERKTIKGAFSFELKPGDYQIVLKSDVYLAQGAPVVVLPDQTANKDFVVKPIPKKRLSKVEKGKISIKIKIPFALGKADLLKAAEFVLDEVVDRILANSQIKKVRVEGHTDNQGKADYNQELSDERARAVVEYLVAKGVPEGRLEAKGYGASQPIAKNTSPRGRAKNRRVVFVIVDGEGGE
jgi:outer membrane protein OmpA-like peptidoglycan-associated protein